MPVPAKPAPAASGTPRNGPTWGSARIAATTSGYGMNGVLTSKRKWVEMELIVVGAIGFLFGGFYGAAVAIVGYFVLVLILAILS